MGSDEELAKIIAYASVQGERQIERRIRWRCFLDRTDHEYYAALPLDKQEALELAQEILLRHEYFKADGDIEFGIINISAKNCWKLVTIYLQLLTGELNYADINFPDINLLLKSAHGDANNAKKFRALLIELCPYFLDHHLFRLSRAIYVLFLAADFNIESTPKTKNEALLFKLKYLTKIFSLSSTATGNDETSDKLFETFAHDLKLEGSCDFPAIIASYDDAKKVFTEILTLLVKYEKKNKKISEKSNKFLNIKFWYGLAYHELSNFLKQDPAQQRKLAQKSLELWSSLLTNSFRSEDLLEYSKASNVEALEIYQTLYIKQSTNYDHILRYKVNYMIHLDFFEAKPYIMELNSIRCNYIRLLKEFEMFATNYPDGIKAETLAQVFDKTAYQLRHMMVENKEQQKQILDESLDYLGKLYTEEMKGQKGATAGSVYQTEMMKLDKRKVNMPEKLVIQSLALSIDSRAFICKFRQ